MIQMTFNFRLPALLTLGLTAATLSGCTSDRNIKSRSIFGMDNVIAWCVVPFDSVERTPTQRARMLADLGFKQFAYDWRERHIPDFSEEIRSLEANDIRLAAVWIWIDPDSTGDLPGEANRRIMETVRDNGVKTDFWVGFSNKNFEGLSEEEKLEKAVNMVRALRDEAAAIGCTISLYNHGDWFGEPENQVKIIERTGLRDIGIVYNFHHAHEQIDHFGDLLNTMMPYLRTVNLNGMRRNDQKILPVGAGDHELDMLKTLKASGFKGTIGIIGHVESEDVRVVLERNLSGLRSLLKEMGEEQALSTYK